MSEKRASLLILAVVWVGGQAWAQSGGNRPIELTIRDNEGKLVTVPPGNPAKPVNYIEWLNETLGKGVVPNAADLYEEACLPVHDTSLDLKGDDLDQALAGPWDNLPGVSTWLTASKTSLRKFRQATSRRQCYFPLPSSDFSDGPEAWAGVKTDPRCREWMIGAFGHHIAAPRSTCKALVAEGWRDWKKGNEDRLIDNAATILRSAQHLDSQPLMVHHLVGTASTALAYDALRGALKHAADPDTLAQRIADRLDAETDPPLNIQGLRWVTCEHLMLRDTCQRMFSPGGQPGTWQVSKHMLTVLAPFNMETLTPGEVPKDADTQLARIGYDATLREFDALFKRVQAFMAKPYPVAVKDGESINASAQQSPNPLVKMAMFDPVYIRGLDERRSTHRRAVRLIVQLHLHHAKHHVFPDRLNDLKTPDLKDIRTDPFSGKDFGYRKQGKSFLLYSVGVNLQDDGGKHDPLWEKDDFVFWPVQKPGVLTLPRATK